MANATAMELEPSPSDARRVDARIDRSRGLLYLVYYPEQENPGESVVLHLQRRAGGRADPEALEVTGKSNSAWAILVLLVLGIGCLVVRLNLNLEAGDSDYRLTYTAEFHVRKPDGRAIVPDARLLAAFPETTRFCRVLEQEIDASGYGTGADPHPHGRRAGKTSCSGPPRRVNSSVRSPFESNSTAKAIGGRMRPKRL